MPSHSLSDDNVFSRPVFAVISASVIFLYIAIRAATVQLVHDEVATFYHFIMHGDFLPYFAVWDANNHVLNSFLSWISMSLFGDHPFFLRLPNLLSLPCYLFFTYRIAGFFPEKRIIPIYLAAAWITPGFIEFFGYTRGYGLSMAFLAGSLYYLMRSWQHPQLKYFLLSLILMITGVAANLTLIISLLLLLGLIFILMLRSRHHYKSSSRYFLQHIAVQLPGWLFVIAIVIYMLDMKKRHLLYYGSLDGFIEVTSATLLKTLAGTSDYLPAIIFTITGACMILASIWILFRNLQERTFPRPDAVFPFFLTGSVAGIFAMALLLKVNYPEDRTGLYLYPYLIGTISFVVSRISKKQISTVLAAMLLLPLPLVFPFKINFTHSMLWRTDRNADDFYDYIAATDSENITKSTIGGRFTRELCWAYKNFRDERDLNLMFIQDYPSSLPDFQIGNHDDMLHHAQKYNVMLYDKPSQNYLLERKVKLQKQPYKQIAVNPGDYPDYEFVPFFEDSVAGLTGRILQFDYSLTYSSPEVKFNGWIVISLHNETGENIYYDRFFLKWPLKDRTLTKTLNYSMLVPPVPDNAITIKFYLWNIHQYPFSIEGGRVNIYLLSDPLNSETTGI